MAYHSRNSRLKSKKLKSINGSKALLSPIIMTTMFYNHKKLYKYEDVKQKIYMFKEVNGRRNIIKTSTITSINYHRLRSAFIYGSEDGIQ